MTLMGSSAINPFRILLSRAYWKYAAPRAEPLLEIRYVGDAYTAETIDAVINLLGEGYRPLRGWIISFLDEDSTSDHSLYLESEGRPTVITGGLTSGYNGEGVRGLATVLCLLREFSCYPSDSGVTRDILDRARHCALTWQDVSVIKSGGNRPSQAVVRYIDAAYHRRDDIWTQGSTIIPWSLIDARLRPLVYDFRTDPDIVLVRSFRLLEDIVRKRLGNRAFNKDGGHIANIWNVAFAPEDSPLHWPLLNAKDAVGRRQLFEGAAATIRNPRAHRENVSNAKAFEELMLINLLYTFEAEAISREPSV